MQRLAATNPKPDTSPKRAVGVQTPIGVSAAALGASGASRGEGQVGRAPSSFSETALRGFRESRA